MFYTSRLRCRPRARPAYDISIKFEIQAKFVVLWFKMGSTDHNEILHTSRQYYYRDVCKISLWSAEYVMNKNIAKFDWISNLFEILLVGWGARCVTDHRSEGWSITKVFCITIIWIQLRKLIAFTRMDKCSCCWLPINCRELDYH